MIDPTPEPRELTRLREHISMCVRRSVRAQQRVRCAEDERQDAERAMRDANAAFEQWLAANPQPQIEMAV